MQIVSTAPCRPSVRAFPRLCRAKPPNRLMCITRLGEGGRGDNAIPLTSLACRFDPHGHDVDIVVLLVAD